jgi:hypothetical protein
MGMTGILASPFVYADRIVAFIDVLGFSELVTASDKDSIALSKLKKLIATYELFERFMRDYFDFAEGDFFSDCFVLSVNTDQVIYLIRETGYLCRHLLLQGFSCRGGISAGALYHHGRVVVGPALIKAYQLERSVAVYPRVLLDDATMACWEEEFRPSSAHPHLQTLVKRDRDGQHFIDIFNPEWGPNFIPWTEFIPSSDSVPTDPIEFLKVAWKRIKDNHAANIGNAKIRAKYEWLATECDQRATALGVKLAA